MTPQEAAKLIKELYYEEDYCLVPELAEAVDLAIKALELKADLIKEIPTFKEVIQANYEIFMKYSINYHTEIEEIAFSNFDKTVANLQWLIGELECDTE